VVIRRVHPIRAGPGRPAAFLRGCQA
jgi:hypothetical protein